MIVPGTIVALLLAIVGVAFGTLLNFRSVRAGRGASPVGLAVQEFTGAAFVAFVTLAMFGMAVQAGYALLGLPLLLGLLVSLGLLISGVQALRSGNRP